MTDNQFPTLDDAERFFAERHGVDPLFELPYPAPQVPQYKEGRYRSWEIGRYDVPILRGYFRGMQTNMRNNYILRKYVRKEPRTWMSLTPMELESHMPHIAAAHGHVLCVGLGLGMYLYNILQKPEVTRVTLIEKEETVLRLLEKRANMKEWPGIEKLRAKVFKDVFSDYAKNCTPVQDGFDVIYADIWETLGDEEARAGMVQIAQSFKSDNQSWWGMELDFIEWCTIHNKEQLTDGAKLTDAMVNASLMPWVLACNEHGLNVTGVTGNPEWASLALKAAHNVTLY